MEAKLVVDSRVRVHGPKGSRDPFWLDVLDLVRARTTHHNPQHAKLRALGMPTWSEPPLIRTWRDERDHLSVPRGALGRVRAVLREAGVGYHVADQREAGEGPPLVAKYTGSLWEYQARAVEDLSARENALMRAPTGGGKTEIAIALAARLGRPTLVLVWNAALLEQWRARLQKALGLRAADIGEIRGARRRLMPVTVAMQQTVAKRLDRELARYFGCVVADEVHRAAARTMFDSIDPFPARYRFGVSASERRKDRKEFLTYDLFGDVAFEVAREDLVRSGHVLDVEVRVVESAFEAPWYGLADEDAPDREVNFDRLLAEMVASPERERLALDAAAAEVAAGEQVLVLSHRREHCVKLRAELAERGVAAGLLLGGPENAEELRRGLARLASGELRAGVGTYQAVGTGIDLPTVAAAVCATPIAGNEQFFNQVRGRVCRTAPGKRGARMYYVLDAAVYPEHLRNILRWNPTVSRRSGDGWEKVPRPRRGGGMNLGGG